MSINEIHTDCFTLDQNYALDFNSNNVSKLLSERLFILFTKTEKNAPQGQKT